jgi:hypothetical protein
MIAPRPVASASLRAFKRDLTDLVSWRCFPLTDSLHERGFAHNLRRAACRQIALSVPLTAFSNARRARRSAIASAVLRPCL